MTESTQMETPLDSPGVLLSNARQAKQLSTADVAQKLCLKVNIIEALEKDEVLSNISLTFTKGYIRSYAKLLGLDEAHIIGLFNEIHASEPALAPKKMQSFSRQLARDNNDSRWMIVTYSLIAVVLFLIVIWWVQHQSSDFFSTTSNVPTPDNTQVARSSTAIPVVTESADSVGSNEQDADNELGQAGEALSDDNPSSDIANSTGQFDTEAGSNTLISETVTETPSTVNLTSESFPTESIPTESIPTESIPTESIPEDALSADTPSNLSLGNQEDVIPDFVPDSTQANIEQVLDVLENETPDVDSELRLFEDDLVASDTADIVELIFSFDKDCWVKITDATGNDIAYGVKKEGRVMPVSGQPPFSVILGAPASVNVQYAGSPVDISFLPSDRTGRFVLPLQE